MINTTEESNARKEKGETLQMDVAAKLRAAFPQYAEDIESTPMSAHGEDIKILSAEARGAIPVSIEAKWKTLKHMLELSSPSVINLATKMRLVIGEHAILELTRFQIDAQLLGQND